MEFIWGRQIRFKACPRCGGALLLDEEWWCLSCGDVKIEDVIQKTKYKERVKR